jgi:hypothetical protein
MSARAAAPTSAPMAIPAIAPFESPEFDDSTRTVEDVVVGLNDAVPTPITAVVAVVVA